MNTHHPSVLFSFLLVVALFACTSEQPNEKQKETSVETPARQVSNESNTTDLPFPVYKDFSQLAPIFQYENDTTYVINFWATWCKPCVAELPYFEKLHAERGDRKLKVILVSLDFAKDVPTKLASFVRKRELQPQVIAFIDGNYNNWIDKVHPDWGGAIPVTYVYNKEQVVFHDEQYSSYEELYKTVEQLAPRG